MSKKLVGGEFLLDLTPVTINKSVDGETYTNITDASVIEQLTNLKTYISNPKAIKPIWIKFENEEDDSVIVTRGSLSIMDTGEFDIDVAIDGYKLKIHVEFTQAELEDHTPIDDWYIDTNDAKYLFTSDEQNLAEFLFDGEVKVTYQIPDYKILDADNPKKIGVYKLYQLSGEEKVYDGILVITAVSSTLMSYFAIRGNRFYSAVNVSLGTFVLITQGFLDTKANPTLEGTESALTGLQVNNVKYKVSGGTKLFQHYLNLTYTDSSTTHLTIITTNETLITLESLYGGSQLALKILGDIINIYGNQQYTNESSQTLYLRNLFYTVMSGENNYAIDGMLFNDSTKLVEEFTFKVLKNTYKTVASITDTVTAL